MNDLTQKSSYHYDLPKEYIAQFPLTEREKCRLLYLDRQSGDTAHLSFPEIKDLLQPDDTLVINTSKVIPARLFGQKITGGKAEVFLLRQVDDYHWECLVKPGNKIKTGTNIVFSNDLQCEVVDILEQGIRLLRFDYNGDFWSFIDQIGKVPLPPYIKRDSEELDKTAYQTVYAEERGSVAAPTAGLHFSPELMEELCEMGVKLAPVILHIGIDTFRPVKVDNILEHKMHSEFCTIPEDSAQIINEAISKRQRVIAVGTTATRTVESFAQKAQAETESNAEKQTYFVGSGSKWTDLFIYPGYEFKAINGLLTNFHLPESSLIMLVSAFGGYENTIKAYREAVAEKYRFFSYGDAMLIT